jgi:hypothetical protein
MATLMTGVVLRRLNLSPLMPKRFLDYFSPYFYWHQGSDPQTVKYTRVLMICMLVTFPISFALITIVLHVLGY